jgi:hypothetical protein
LSTTILDSTQSTVSQRGATYDCAVPLCGEGDREEGRKGRRFTIGDNHHVAAAKIGDMMEGFEALEAG